MSLIPIALLIWVKVQWSTILLL